MAAAAAAGQTLRLCVRSCRRVTSATQRIAPRAAAAAAAATQLANPLQQQLQQPQQPQQRRTFAASSARHAGNDGKRGSGAYADEIDLTDPEWARESVDEIVQKLKPSEVQALEAMRRQLDPSVAAQRVPLADFLEKHMGEDEHELARVNDGKPLVSDPEWKQVSRMERMFRRDFWYDEDDPDALKVPADEFDEDDITPMAHAKLDEIREHRHYHRIMAWEMPLLSKLAKPFEPPAEDEVLRFRYTTYMGEFHPAENKVVVQFSPADLKLTPVQADKLRKLVGARYNPETDVIKMSSDKFEHQAQNKRYLSDLVDKLIETAKDPKDTFEDVPIDTRHHVFKTTPHFPKEWRMTEQRRQELEAFRAQQLQLETGKEEGGQIVDGKEKIETFFAMLSEEAEGKAKDAVLAGVKGGSRAQEAHRPYQRHHHR